MNKKAFTLAEVLIVLTILGIIAAISMTTLRPAEFKLKGLQVAAKKVLYDIDTATTEILINETGSETTATLTSTQCAHATLAGLYKKYVSATRKATTTSDCSANDTTSFFLKSGACIRIEAAASTAKQMWFPGESTTEATNSTSDCAVIFYDTNGSDGPNIMGADRFIIPLDKTGIKYAG